jgi:hypothetical protein
VIGLGLRETIFSCGAVSKFAAIEPCCGSMALLRYQPAQGFSPRPIRSVISA